ncbi:MAG: hypothetical protein AAF311_12085 [Pseudomonadota bacterium]
MKRRIFRAWRRFIHLVALPLRLRLTVILMALASGTQPVVAQQDTDRWVPISDEMLSALRGERSVYDVAEEESRPIGLYWATDIHDDTGDEPLLSDTSWGVTSDPYAEALRRLERFDLSRCGTACKFDPYLEWAPWAGRLSGMN